MNITETLERIQVSRAHSPASTTPSYDLDNETQGATSTAHEPPVRDTTASHQYTSTAELPPSSKQTLRISTSDTNPPACSNPTDSRAFTFGITTITPLLSSTVAPSTPSFASLNFGNPLATPQFRTGTTSHFSSVTTSHVSSFAPLSFGDPSMSLRPRSCISAPYPQFLVNPSTTSQLRTSVPAPFLSPTAPPFRPHIPNLFSRGQLPSNHGILTTTAPPAEHWTYPGLFLPPTGHPYPNTLDPQTPLVSDHHVPSTTAHQSQPQVRIPKLTIKKYNGDLTKWLPFWDSFQSSIHDNPNLSDIDKFNYLTSLLESSAADAIAGLSVTSANYEEAVSTLKKRFGNVQSIINKHMDSLLAVQAVSSNDVKGLRRLSDTVESHVRGLRALGVPYGGLLTSVLVNKLPTDIKLIINRTMSTGQWELKKVLEILTKEVDARERTAPASSTPPRKTPTRLPTSSTLLTSNSSRSSNTISCTYCRKNHQSASCTEITDVNSRRGILRSLGRCYICLRKGHMSKNCTSNITCKKCRGRHHVSICQPLPDTQPSPKEANKQ